MQRSIDIAIVNWNTAEAAILAAESFVASRGVEVRVKIVDNFSRYSQRQMLHSKMTDTNIEVQLSDRNLGYGGAANLALRDGQAPFVCISNADVAPHPDAMAALMAGALEHRNAGMVGPVFDGGTQHYHSCLPGRFSLLGRTFIGSVGRRSPRPPAPGEILWIEQVSGACFLMSRETWEEVGGFDDGYFLWYDDVDLAKRLVDRGHRNLVLGSARVRHTGAASFTQIGRDTAQAIRLASLDRYIDKHNPELLPLARPLVHAAQTIRARGATGHSTS